MEFEELKDGMDVVVPRPNSLLPVPRHQRGKVHSIDHSDMTANVVFDGYGACWLGVDAIKLLEPVAADAPAVGAPVPESLEKLRAERDTFKLAAELLVKERDEMRSHLPDERSPFASINRATRGDLLAERDKLRADVARLEGDVSYWQREAVRLGGKNRGAR